MSGILPAGSVTGPQATGRTASPLAGGGAKSGKGFADAMRDMIDVVDKDQQTSASAIRDLIAGKSDDILPVVEAAAKADMSFKLLMGIRNKVIEAYKQTMQMQI
jgi:flagellar hook-basal body complex protein FliE